MSAAPTDLPPASAAAQPWQAIVKKWQEPSLVRACWQLVATLTCYVGLWVGLYWSLEVSWWLTVPIAALTGMLMVRVFILFHDCGHGSFFRSRTANDMVGRVLGLLTFTPYEQWRTEHAIHHATTCDLNRRGTGDVWTMTVQEYLEASRWKRFAYRVVRNPLILFVIGPLLVFLIQQRFPNAKASPLARRSVYWTNLAILGVAAALSMIMGVKAYLVIQLTVTMVASSAGVWLFYVQHQFEGVYWQRSDQWDYTAAAMQGSSFYKLPRILQWFTGSIGFHHLHHLSPRIPNYNLEKCHQAEPLFQSVPSITLLASFKSLTFRLWDEQRRKLVGFGHLRTLRKERMAAAPGPGS